jgi:predicted nuclease with TOPRIM domain
MGKSLEIFMLQMDMMDARSDIEELGYRVKKLEKEKSKLETLTRLMRKKEKLIERKKK